MNKIFSARYVLTIICGVVFAYATYKLILTPETVTAIITMVFVAYFQRNDRKEKAT